MASKYNNTQLKGITWETNVNLTANSSLCRHALRFCSKTSWDFLQIIYFQLKSISFLCHISVALNGAIQASEKTANITTKQYQLTHKQQAMIHSQTTVNTVLTRANQLETAQCPRLYFDSRFGYYVAVVLSFLRSQINPAIISVTYVVQPAGQSYSKLHYNEPRNNEIPCITNTIHEPNWLEIYTDP